MDQFDPWQVVLRQVFPPVNFNCCCQSCWLSLGIRYVKTTYCTNKPTKLLCPLSSDLIHNKRLQKMKSTTRKIVVILFIKTEVIVLS